MDVINKRLSISEQRELKKFGSIINNFGANFAVCDSDGEILLLCEGSKFNSSKEQLKQLCRRILEQTPPSRIYSETPVMCFDDADSVLITALISGSQNGINCSDTVAVVLIDLGPVLSFGVQYISDATENQICYCKEMLRLLAEKFQANSKADEQIEKFSTELSRVYEELVLLHKISTNMKVTEADTNFLQIACDSLTEIVYVEGIAILLERTIDNQQQLVIAAGSGLIDLDEETSDLLHSRLTDEINKGKEALLDSEVDSPFKYNWPESVKNIIAVPLYGKEKSESHLPGNDHNSNSIIGFMVAVNRIGKQDFDSTDIKLFNSVASGCAVFIENGRLFKDLKELFIGSLKALTSSIDAKDKYTHGHSERVAIISRWIAEKLSNEEQLEREDINAIYLAGLLHDIGKIGIDEMVLKKIGKLTDQEYACIKVHPLIGANILREIKQMREIVPGVLCHHERIDGKGYPNGLEGQQIPLIGKIVGLADSFDAMTSKRTYRDAMTLQQALEEVKKGLGTQFDEKIGRIFLESDITELWNSIRDGFDEVGASAEYGSEAVETLIG